MFAGEAKFYERELPIPQRLRQRVENVQHGLTPVECTSQKQKVEMFGNATNLYCVLMPDI